MWAVQLGLTDGTSDTALKFQGSARILSCFRIPVLAPRIRHPTLGSDTRPPEWAAAQNAAMIRRHRVTIVTQGSCGSFAASIVVPLCAISGSATYSLYPAITRTRAHGKRTK